VHEYSLVQAMLSRVDAEARARNAVRVRALAVRIGDASGVEPDCFAAAYELFREQTVCEGAPLRVERVATAWACSQCGLPMTPGAVLTCGVCGAPGRLTQGDEIVLSSIELEVA